MNFWLEIDTLCLLSKFLTTNVLHITAIIHKWRCSKNLVKYTALVIIIERDKNPSQRFLAKQLTHNGEKNEHSNQSNTRR